MKILKRGILVVAALTLFAIILVSCLSGGRMTTIAITPPNPFMARGSTQQFTATATLSDGTTINWTQAVNWTASDPTFTFSNTVPTNGLGYAPTPAGTTTYTIIATDPLNSIASSATVTVKDPDSITISPANPYMAIGTIHQFAVLAIFSSGTYTQDLTSSPSVTWSTDNSFATVSTTTGSFGLVTANTATPGTVHIMVQSLNGSPINEATTLTVTATQLGSITVTPPIPPATSTTIAVSSSQQFTATGNYPNDSSTPTQPFTNSVTWSSSNPAVATIDPNSGKATGVATGTTTITVTDPITSTVGSTTLIVQ